MAKTGFRSNPYSNPLDYPIEVIYTNSKGFECKALVKHPNEVHHSWYSSKRNIFGVYDKHSVTVIQAFLRKLRNCTNIRMVQSESFIE